MTDISKMMDEVYMRDAPVSRMGELYRKLYYHLAKALVDKFGEEGEKALREAIRNFAFDKGETMARQAKAIGLPLT